MVAFEKSIIRHMKKKNILIGLAILVTCLIIVLVGYRWGNNPPDPAGTQTLSQGTQMRYGDINIALSNVDDSSAWLSFRNSKTDETTQKQVKAGESVDVYDYTIKINTVTKSANPSTAPGSSQGNVKFVINKQ